MGGYSLLTDTMADMTWPQVEAAAARGALLLIPVAVIEQHGPHLPLATDIYGAYTMCALARQELERLGRPTVIAPPSYFGINSSTHMFPGSINLRPETLTALLTDCMLSYHAFGFRRQFLLNHHGDPHHNAAIIEAISAVRAQGVEAVFALAGFPLEFITQAYTATFKKPLPLPPEAILTAAPSPETTEARRRLMKSTYTVHAEERETSLIMRYFPELVDHGVDVKALPPVVPSEAEFRAAVGAGKWREVSPLGYIGDPSVATAENGELYAYESRDLARAIDQFMAG